MSTRIDTIAIVTNKFGDPEAFAERDVELCNGFQKVAIGTNLVDRRHLVLLQEENQKLIQIAHDAVLTAKVAAKWLSKAHPIQAQASFDAVDTIAASLEQVLNEKRSQ